MDKLLNLAIDGVLDVFVKPGCNFGHLTKDEYEKYCGQGERLPGSTYELLNFTIVHLPPLPCLGKITDRYTDFLQTQVPSSNSNLRDVHNKIE